MHPTIEQHFLACLLMLGPPASRHHAFTDSNYFHDVVAWWEEDVGTAGTHWYAGWYCKWVLNGCKECKPCTTFEE